MKVLHILDHSIPLHSGYTFRSRSIILQQRALGIETCHITSEKQGNDESLTKEAADGLDFYRTAPNTSFWSRLPVLGQLSVVWSLKKRLKEVVEQERPNVLHAHSPALNGLAALWIAKQFNLPVVYEVRGFWEDAAVDHGTCKEGDLRYRFSKMLETYVVKKAHAVTAICNGIKNDFISRGIDGEKITLIPNAVNVEAFPQIEQRSEGLVKKLGLENTFVLGFAGSFYQYEGIDILIKSLAVLKEQGLQVKVLLVGGGVQQSNIEALVNELGLQNDVIMTGRVPHAQVRDYYSVMDATVLPRKSMRLTELVTPLKPLEAMALGVPIVASNIGGHKEIITDHKNGFLFKADDEAALAELLESLIKNKERLNSVKANGRLHVENERNWKVSVSNYPHVYNYAVTQL